MQNCGDDGRNKLGEWRKNPYFSYSGAFGDSFVQEDGNTRFVGGKTTSLACVHLSLVMLALIGCICMIY
jgi:hypothetical protein